MARSLIVWVVTGFLLLHNGDSLNVLWVNEMRNEVANATLKAVFESVRPSIADLTVEELLIDNENASVAIKDVCGAVTEFFGPAGPDLVLDTTLGGESVDALRSLAWTLGLPTVSMAFGDKHDIGEWDDMSEEQSQYLLHGRPPADLATYAIRNIISENNITNAAIIFDDTFVYHYKYRSLLMNVPTRHLINKMKTDDNAIMEHLKLMQRIDLNNIFLSMSNENAARYLSIASSMGMYGRKYSWFLLTLDVAKELKCPNCEDMAVVTMSPVPEFSQKNKAAELKEMYNIDAMFNDVVVAFYYDYAKLALMAANEAKSTGGFTLSTCEDYTALEPVTRTDVNLREKFLDLTDNSATNYGFMRREAYDFLIDVYRLMYKKSKLTRTQTIGKFKTSDNRLVFNPGKTLNNVAATTVYQVATVIQAPFVMLKNGSTTEYEGYCIDLINELKNLMGFEYEIYEAPDGVYGNMNEKMEWNGMIKELVFKNADIGLGALSVMAERENVVDFTVPYYDLVGITILMKKPKVPTSLFKFLSVLEDSVWGCILAAYFVTSLLMWIFDRWSPYSYQNNMEKYKDDDEKRYFNFKECLWFCMTSLTPQGGGEAPKNLSGRLVAATWWLFGFIIIASYTANLAAFLTVSRLETPVESLEDLAKQYKIQYSPMNGSATMTYFERMAYIEEKFYQIWKDMSLNDSMSDLERSKLAVWDYPVSDKYTKMWQSMQEAVLPMTFDEALDRVRASPTSSEGFAFLGDATDIRYQVLTNCDLQMVGEEFSRKPYALAVQQGSPLKDQFNDAILKLLNQRKLETLKERWWNQNPLKKVCDDEDDSGGGISIYNIGGVFIVIFVGIGLAIITLIIEYWYYKYKKPQMRIDSAEGKKQLQVKQAASGFADKENYQTEYRTNATIAPVANPW